MKVFTAQSTPPIKQGNTASRFSSSEVIPAGKQGVSPCTRQMGQTHPTRMLIPRKLGMMEGFF